MEQYKVLAEAAAIAKAFIKTCETENVSPAMLEVVVALLVSAIKLASGDADRFANLITISLENDELLTIH
jgi:hypothetical protein